MLPLQKNFFKLIVLSDSTLHPLQCISCSALIVTFWTINPNKHSTAPNHLMNSPSLRIKSNLFSLAYKASLVFGDQGFSNLTLWMFGLDNSFDGNLWDQSHWETKRRQWASSKARGLLKEGSHRVRGEVVELTPVPTRVREKKKLTWGSSLVFLWLGVSIPHHEEV